VKRIREEVCTNCFLDIVVTGLLWTADAVQNLSMFLVFWMQILVLVFLWCFGIVGWVTGEASVL